MGPTPLPAALPRPVLGVSEKGRHLRTELQAAHARLFTERAYATARRLAAPRARGFGKGPPSSDIAASSPKFSGSRIGLPHPLPHPAARGFGKSATTSEHSRKQPTLGFSRRGPTPHGEGLRHCPPVCGAPHSGLCERVAAFGITWKQPHAQGLRERDAAFGHRPAPPRTRSFRKSATTFGHSRKQPHAQGFGDLEIGPPPSATIASIPRTGLYPARLHLPRTPAPIPRASLYPTRPPLSHGSATPRLSVPDARAATNARTAGTWRTPHAAKTHAPAPGAIARSVTACPSLIASC